MGLKSLMQYLKKPVADTPDTSEKSMGYQCKAPIHAGCTPDTPDTSINTSRVRQFSAWALCLLFMVLPLCRPPPRAACPVRWRW